MDMLLAVVITFVAVYSSSTVERAGGSIIMASTFKAFLNSPVGPKTTHFWGPVANWGFVAAVRLLSDQDYILLFPMLCVNGLFENFLLIC